MCRSTCKICDHLVLSQSVSFADGTLTINLPAGSYNNREQYCIVVAQSIPTTVTIGAPVVVTIGDGTQEYPLTKCNCAQATVCNIRTRTRYAVKLSTTATGGTFRLLGRVCCAPENTLASVDGTAPTAEEST